MTSEHDTLARLVAYHDHIAVPPVPIADDVRRGRRRVQVKRGVITGAVTLAVAGAVAAASLLDGGVQDSRPQPAGPASSAPPAPVNTTDAPGPLRDGTSLPVVSPQVVPPSAAHDRRLVWTDGRDVEVAAIDVREVIVEPFGGSIGLDWSLELRGDFPASHGLAEAGRIIEYGLVVDADRDRVADCHIGIATTGSSSPGDYRVWVENLTTGIVDERVGAPYGVPIDFVHPGESPRGRSMKFYFVFANREPCAPFGAAARFYAWASVTDDGQLAAWDYAPDQAWLEMSP